MRFLISLVMPETVAGHQRAEMTALLAEMRAVPIAPYLWILDGKEAEPSYSEVIADRIVNVIGEGGEARCMVFPLPHGADGFGLDRDTETAVGG